MALLVFTHDAALRHDTGPGHPERPERIGAALDGVYRSGVAHEVRSPPEATNGVLTAVHDPEYVARLEDFCKAGGGGLDPDTWVGEGSWEAALRAAGAGPAAVAALEGEPHGPAFSIMRPPGHHARPAQAMGFCLFNNIAVAAAQLTARGSRVAIVDWDVHHGNGTQEVFYGDPMVLYLSLHQSPFYPGTGAAAELGSGEGLGTTINVPLPAGSNGSLYRSAFPRLVIPIVEQFAPDWLLVSCGYDAHRADPLAAMGLLAEDYRVMASALAAVVAKDRTVYFLEGGYDLEAISSSVAATVEGVETPSYLRADEAIAGAAGMRGLQDALAAARAHWELG